jgi:hypothetical protein
LCPALVVSSVADPDPLVRDADPDPYKNVVDSKHWDLNWFYLSSIISVELSVADPGLGTFLTPGSGMGESQHQDPGSGMNNPDHIF